MECIYRVNLKSVQFIKKAVQSALAIDHNPQEVHNRLIEVYWRLCNDTGDKLYFELAFEHLGAYISAGYKPTALSPKAEEILEKAGYRSICHYLHAIHYKRDLYYVRLTRSRIRTLLGKGYAAKANSGITKNAMVDDILKKIADRAVGTYCYKVEYGKEIRLSYLIIQNETDVYMQNNEGTQYKFIDLLPIETLKAYIDCPKDAESTRLSKL